MSIKSVTKNKSTFVTVADTVTIPFIKFKQFTQTESGINCIGCNNQVTDPSIDSEEVKSFNTLSIADRSQLLLSKMGRMVENFCNTCGIDIEDFIVYAEKRFEDEKIPEEIIFAMMYKESSGDCTEKQENISELSYGLLQLNKLKGKGSTDLNQCNENQINEHQPPNISHQEMKAVCLNGNYREGTECNPRTKIGIDRQKVCLNNPYCNLEEAINTINCKWLTVNECKCSDYKKLSSEEERICNNINADGSQIMSEERFEEWKNQTENKCRCKNLGRLSETMKPLCVGPYRNDSPRMPNGSKRSWQDLTEQERNLWRYTIGYYNTGTYISDAEKEIISNREELKKRLGIKVDISDWALIRMYILNLCDEAIEGSRSQRRPLVCIHLAYTDHITGLENNVNREGGSTGSLIQDWIEYKKNNTPIKCPDKLKTPKI